MQQDQLKQNAAKEAIKLIEDDMVVGVGTGSTVNFFIEELALIKNRIDATVASSDVSAEKLKALGMRVLDLNTANVDIYVDGADAFTNNFDLTKGGGGALTREKIIAAASSKFICITDQSKQVGFLGEFPIAVEVIPMARSLVGRELLKLGADPVYREDFVTDNGNVIIDAYNFKISNPQQLEASINNIPGVVDNGIFAKYRPHKIICAMNNKVEIFKR